jgi:predicted transcriptional regulator
MLADKKRILQVIASKPGLRTVEVAETVDCEMDMVEAYIREELKNGIVKIEKVQVPGGREVNSYIMRADCVHLYTPKTVEEIPEQPIKRKGELAVEFLQKNGGRANRDQLLIAMGLTRTHRPGSMVDRGNAPRRDSEGWRRLDSRLGRGSDFSAGEFILLRALV